KEAGLPEFQAQAWNALFAPKDTPQPILDKLSAALDKALDDEQTRKRLLELGSVLPDKAGRGQQALAALGKSENARGRPIINAAGPTNWRLYSQLVLHISSIAGRAVDSACRVGSLPPEDRSHAPVP